MKKKTVGSGRPKFDSWIRLSFLCGGVAGALSGLMAGQIFSKSEGFYKQAIRDAYHIGRESVVLEIVGDEIGEVR